MDVAHIKIITSRAIQTTGPLIVIVCRRKKLNLYVYSYCMCCLTTGVFIIQQCWECEFILISRPGTSKTNLALKKRKKINEQSILSTSMAEGFSRSFAGSPSWKPYNLKTIKKNFLRSFTFHICSVQKYYTSLNPSSCSTEPERIREN
jgi:hypothetical protein